MMKPNTLAIVIGAGLALMTGIASAGDETLQQPLRQVTVQPQPMLPYATADRPLGDCTPPSDLPACTALHRQIRNEFSKREIGMLFGAASSYPEYLTSYSRVTAHYRGFLRNYEAGNTLPVALVSK